MKSSPEAAIAKRIAIRHKFRPGDNLQKLVEQYADVELISFPVDNVDGISLYLKSPIRRPNILINLNIVETRAKFTLAHEFGHVIIPWHFGTVFSNISKYEGSVNFAYREMEAEANRFAAELLMPQEWLIALYAASKDPSKVLQCVLDTCGTSPAAAVIALNNSLPCGYVYAQTNGDGVVTKSNATAGTFAAPFRAGDILKESARMQECIAFNDLKLRDITHSWLLFQSEQELEEVSDTREWREVLDEIISDVDPTNNQSKIKMSLNGIISACNKKDVTREVFFASVRQKLSGRDALKQNILNHHLFNTFLIKRIEEFIARKER